MKTIIAALVAASAIASLATAANAQPNHRHHHQVCTWRHHHRVCYWR